MRFNVFTVACAICLASEAALRFTPSVMRADLGISLPCPVGATGEPLDMPRAEAYLVTRDDSKFLEDRYDSFDLWVLRTLRGRWRDESGNRLYVARLDSVPLDDAPGTVRSRVSFRDAMSAVRMNHKDASKRDEAARAVSPVELGMPVKPRRSQRRNFTDLIAYSVTNENVIAYAFRPKNPDNAKPTPPWYLAVLTVSEKENMAEARVRFDEDFLDNVFIPSRTKIPVQDETAVSEVELLRADVHAQVANYDEWTSTDADDVTVLDNLDPGTRLRFVSALTNELPRLRREYALRIPTPLVGTNALAVVRMFRDREDYLAYVGVDRQWTAAVWSPLRRELVMFDTADGTDSLLSTARHEAFHQYLAYAGSMIESSPWFNEGHAQLFANVRFSDKGEIVFMRDERAAAYVHEHAEKLAESLPDVFKMNYAEFYDGTHEEVTAKYRLAWSVAYFLEVGAPKIRFRPYESFRADYMKALIRTQSMHEATNAVLGNEKSRDEFVAAWLAFWREQ